MGAAFSFIVSTPASRLAWIDRLRTVTIAGVVVAHAATAYVIDYSWYYEERIASETIQLALLIEHRPRNPWLQPWGGKGGYWLGWFFTYCWRISHGAPPSVATT